MRSNRLHEIFSGLLLIAGSLIFLGGGAFHPKINSSLGMMGSEEFFTNFYMHIAHHQSWELIHGMILAGPLLWLLGVASRWNERSGWMQLAKAALTVAAAAWAVVFVFDGFVAPFIVRSLSLQDGRMPLAVNQTAVIRLGLVAWLMLSVGMISGSIGMLAEQSRFVRILSVIGLLLGSWPFVAWITGSFVPGPFTSRYWNPTAILTAFWFAALGVSLLIARTQHRETAAPAT